MKKFVAAFLLLLVLFLNVTPGLTEADRFYTLIPYEEGCVVKTEAIGGEEVEYDLIHVFEWDEQELAVIALNEPLEKPWSISSDGESILGSFWLPSWLKANSEFVLVRLPEEVDIAEFEIAFARNYLEIDLSSFLISADISGLDSDVWLGFDLRQGRKDFYSWANKEKALVFDGEKTVTLPNLTGDGGEEATFTFGTFAEWMEYFGESPETQAEILALLD